MTTLKAVEGVIVILLSVFSSPVFSSTMSRQSVVDSYGSCTWRDNGDGSTTVSLVINFKAATAENMGGGGDFRSRTIMIRGYDKNQKIHDGGQTGFPVVNALNGISSNYGLNIAYGEWPGTVLYRDGGDARDGAWHNPNAFSAAVSVTFHGKKWRAVSVTAGNKGYLLAAYDDTFAEEQTGAAYLYPESDGASCQVVDPIDPPKPPVTIRMFAPDWDLGELPMQYGEKKFTTLIDQLCFTYSGLSGDGVDVIVDADSKNGVVENQYQLKNLSDLRRLSRIV
ncbi:hypothetical protein [Burkholderia perseverans]|uniref:hypothetical protein n=1 Tax=Burkholderia perseverans TaxID=2615214 RepID=UPI001FEE05F1|nr:hypothetical protein [Burkholderia perseverans]